jgi:hypothetical protein
MGKYGLAAVNAIKLIESKEADSPVKAWQLVTIDIFGKGTHAQKKGCPKGAFLGLCEDGLVRGVLPGNYTKSLKNKAYAIKAVELLKDNPSLMADINELWAFVMEGEDKSHNSQMDVVVSLWKNALLKYKTN